MSELSNNGFVDGQWREVDLAAVERQLYDKGFELAKRSGARQAEEASLSSLTDLADRASGRFAAAPYEPGTNIADEYAENRYQGGLGDEADLKQQVAYAHAHWRERAMELAALGDGPERPTFPLFLAMTAVLAIGLTIAPTLHDLLFVALLGRGAPALGGALLAGALIAAVLVWGILGRSDGPAGSRLERLAWTGLGVLFGVALYLMRASLSHGNEEQLLSLGLAVLEAVFIVLVERVAAARARHLAAVQEDLQAKAAAERQLAAAKGLLEDRKQALAECQSKLDHHQERVREREHLTRAAPKFQEAARAAARAGYEAGLASNRGIVNDGAFRPPSALEVRGRKMENH